MAAGGGVGLGFGGTALAVRAAHVEVANGFSPMLLLGRPSTYLVVGFWMVGTVGYCVALACGDVGSVTAVFTVTEVVLPGLFGIRLLRDHVRAGWGRPFVVGLTVAVAGVVVLAGRRNRDAVRGRAGGESSPCRPGTTSWRSGPRCRP